MVLQRNADGGAQRIAIILHDFASGGTERIIIRLANLWAAAGRDVTILCGSEAGPARGLVGAGVAVCETIPATPRAIGSRRRLAQRLLHAFSERHYDVIVGPGNYHLPILANLISRGVTIPIVAKLSNPLERADLGSLSRALFRRAKRAQAKGTAQLVTMSQALAVEARRTIPSVPISVIPEPIIDRPLAPLDMKPEATTPRLLVAGRLVPQKRVALALQMLAAWHRRDARLTIVGDGPERAALERLAMKLDIADRVYFAGQVPDLAPWFAESDVLLSTSTYEGFPAILVEAIVAGVPVVTTASSVALPEILCDASFGAIATAESTALATALDTLLSGPPVDETARLALAARHKAPTSAKRWLDLLDRVVAERG
jgi:glycosyltransferase involved in cell wall biosynthesis